MNFEKQVLYGERVKKISYIIDRKVENFGSFPGAVAEPEISTAPSRLDYCRSKIKIRYHFLQVNILRQLFRVILSDTGPQTYQAFPSSLEISSGNVEILPASPASPFRTSSPASPASPSNPASPASLKVSTSSLLFAPSSLQAPLSSLQVAPSSLQVASSLVAPSSSLQASPFNIQKPLSVNNILSGSLSVSSSSTDPQEQGKNP
jgi:hypothetical protein